MSIPSFNFAIKIRAFIKVRAMKKRLIDERLRKPKSEHDFKKCARHAKLRFLQRFNHSLTNDELQEIELLIFSGHGSLVHWAHGEPGVYELKWRGFEFYAVFEYKTFKVITFLTKGMEFTEFEDKWPFTLAQF